MRYNCICLFLKGVYEMKNVKITVEYDENKFNALERYALKSEKSIEDELMATVEKLYTELVPKDVREYIEDSDKKAVKKPKKNKKAKANEDKNKEESGQNHEHNPTQKNHHEHNITESAS